MNHRVNDIAHFLVPPGIHNQALIDHRGGATLLNSLYLWEGVYSESNEGLAMSMKEFNIGCV